MGEPFSSDHTTTFERIFSAKLIDLGLAVRVYGDGWRGSVAKAGQTQDVRFLNLLRIKWSSFVRMAFAGLPCALPTHSARGVPPNGSVNMRIPP